MAVVFRVPVPVQPMKAMTVMAIATALPPDVIAAGALTVRALFVVLGLTGLLDRPARSMPLAVVRGVQLAVGVALAKVAHGLVADPADVFTIALPPLPTIALAGVTPADTTTALLVTQAMWHVRLLASLRRRADVAIAPAVGAGSPVVNLGALVVVVATAVWWAVPALRRGPTTGRTDDSLGDGVGEGSGGVRTA